jgi:hypothetical protein
VLKVIDNDEKVDENDLLESQNHFSQKIEKEIRKRVRAEKKESEPVSVDDKENEYAAELQNVADAKTVKEKKNLLDALIKNASNAWLKRNLDRIIAQMKKDGSFQETFTTMSVGALRKLMITEHDPSIVNPKTGLVLKDAFKKFVESYGKTIERQIGLEAHHPWNAQIHHTLQPVAGVFPTYYNVLHTKQDMTMAAPYVGDTEATYRAYHLYAGVGTCPKSGFKVNEPVAAAVATTATALPPLVACDVLGQEIVTTAIPTKKIPNLVRIKQPTAAAPVPVATKLPELVKIKKQPALVATKLPELARIKQQQPQSTEPKMPGLRPVAAVAARVTAAATVPKMPALAPVRSPVESVMVHSDSDEELPMSVHDVLK